MYKYIFLFASMIFFSCNSSEVERVAVADAQASLAIEGMTCEVGCKKVIEKKMRAFAGVVKFDIDFENQIAAVEYDSQMISAEDIVAEINQINNGAYSAALN